MAENGVIKKLTPAERSFYTAAEVRVIMDVSRDTAYRMIRSLRSELIAEGNWAKCIDLLHENGAENVYFVPIPNERTGGSLYYSDVAFTDKNGVINRAYETRIKVVIDDKEYIMQSPVMNGTNPVKDNSMSQQRVWNSMCRSFVKCVAIHTGLGFNLWLKEEHKPFSNEIPGDEPLATEAQIKMIKSIGQKHNINLEYWISSNGKTWKTLTEIDAGHMLNALKEKYGDD